MTTLKRIISGALALTFSATILISSVSSADRSSISHGIPPHRPSLSCRS